MQREKEGGLGMYFFVYYSIECSFNKWSDIKQVLFLL